MVRYIVRRLVWALVTLVIVSFLTFVIFYVLPPGDPAVLRVGHFPNPQLLISIRHAYGLDKPFWVQYWRYMRAIVLHFNFGFSYQHEAPVVRLILDRLPPTISLMVGAVIIWLAIGSRSESSRPSGGAPSLTEWRWAVRCWPSRSRFTCLAC
jgi:peptide/nickel transport system permease protein